MKLFKSCVVLILLASIASAQQQADLEFNVSVADPAYSKNGPRVLFDEAHHNFHTYDGRYKPFVELLLNDGYRVIRSRQPFSKKSLDSFKVLVIANADAVISATSTGSGAVSAATRLCCASR